jgi:stage V sporulation protein B
MFEGEGQDSTALRREAVDVAGLAGRGTLYMTAAKVYFILSGYVIHFLLPRLMTVEQFGLYEVVVKAVSIVNAVVIVGTYQAVSRYISEEEDKADSVRFKALRLQLLVGGGISVGFFLAAPAISSYMNDLRLADYLRLASLITLAYSFYAVFTGYFNGQRKFLAQAAIDMAYSTLKLVFISLFVWLGYGVAGGIGGFALAVASAFLIAVAVAGRGEKRGEVRARGLLKFQVYLLLFTLVLNLLQRLDLMLVKALSSPDAAAASENAGYYSAAMNLANITHQVIASAVPIMFPLISRVTFLEDRAEARIYMANAVRYTLMVMAAVATIFSANSEQALSFVYPPGYQAGQRALAIASYGMLLFGLLQVFTTIISASGRPLISLAVGMMTLALSAALNSALIPQYGIAGASAATAASMLFGVLAGGSYLWRSFGGFISPISLIRIAGCCAAVYAASSLIGRAPKPLIPAKFISLGFIYLIALALSREIGRKELEIVKRIIKR